MKTVESLRVTPLVENGASGRGFLAEHGLAFWIEADGRKVLFDTGQTSRVIEHNARALGIELGGVEALVLSHGHDDHTGGLSAVLKAGDPARVVVHPAALEPKVVRHEGEAPRASGMSARHVRQIRDRGRGVILNRDPVELFPGLHVTGEIPRRTSFEKAHPAFFADAEGTQPDPMLDDQALYAVTPGGVVVFLGCAHAGVVNTLDYIRSLTGGRNLLAVIGGLHLENVPVKRLEATAAAFLRHGVHRLAPCHCTGFEATAFLWARLRGQCVACHVGTSLEF